MMSLFPLVFIAFYKSYFVSFPRFNLKIHFYDHLHAVLATCWILMLVIQPILINNRKYDLHRKIGRLSYLLFPLLILSFVPREIVLFHSDAPDDLFFPIADTVVLIPLYLLAINYKNYVPYHMRYMISSAFVLLGPLVGRIGPKWFVWSAIFTQNIQYSLIYGILIGLIIYDRNFKKSRPYFVAIGLFLLHQIFFYLIFL